MVPRWVSCSVKPVESLPMPGSRAGLASANDYRSQAAAGDGSARMSSGTRVQDCPEGPSVIELPRLTLLKHEAQGAHQGYVVGPAGLTRGPGHRAAGIDYGVGGSGAGRVHPEKPGE